MTAEIILIKARLSSAYCSSDKLWADWAKLKGFSFSQILRLFEIWYHWYVCRYLAVKLQVDTNSKNQEELQCRQVVRQEYQSLHFKFMDKFRSYVPEENVVAEYIKRLQRNPIVYARGLIVMREFLRYMYIYHIFDEKATERLGEALESAMAELEKL